MSTNIQCHGEYFDAQAVIVTVCSTLALYNGIELLLLIFTTFKEYRGLYFWSLLVASFGILPYVLGFLMTYFLLTNLYWGYIIDSYGWVTLITGQSVVLYSRLHLVLQNRHILRAVKWMIVVDGLVLHSVTTVFLFASSYGSAQTQFNEGFKYVEKVQMTIFCTQEFIISGLYVWKTANLLEVVSKQGLRRLMWELFLINIIIIAMDIALLVLEYRNLRVMEQTFKAVIYSIKLKLEFAILGKLVKIAESSDRNLSTAFADVGDYVDETKTNSDLAKVCSSALQPNSRPQWIDDLDKASSSHVETPTYNHSDQHSTWAEEESEVETARKCSRQGLGTGTRLRADSDLMYAEVMRSLSQ